MFTYFFFVKPFLLEYIESGKKDLEVRLFEGDFKNINVDDIIVFNDRCDRRVSKVRLYRNFNEMITKEPARRICPGANGSQVLEGLRSIYSGRDHKVGVVIFELSVVGQILIAPRYTGCSDFDYTVLSSGRLLSLEEVFSRGLATEERFRQQDGLHYTYSWYELRPGDEVKITTTQGASTFIVPSTPLHDLPQKMGDDRAFSLNSYFSSRC